MNFEVNKAYNREAFLSFLADSFLPEDFRTKHHAEEITLSGNQNFTTSVFRLGECSSLELEVFEVHHTSLNDARVGIAKDAFHLMLNHSYCNRALIAFIPDGSNQWRFSLLQMEAELSPSNRIQRSYSNPRRYSFLLGESGAYHTPKKYLIDLGRVGDLNDLLSRFSVEALTKEFYNKLYNWYLWAIDKRSKVNFPKHLDSAQDKFENKQTKVIRLITRMLFVWFIKQKHLVPDNLFDVDFLKTILKDFEPTSKKNGDYYNAILQNLFFATLNQEIEGRTLFTTAKGMSSYYGNKQLYRDVDKSYFTFPLEERKQRIVGLFKDIPYLNGGLFECLDQYKAEEQENGTDKLKQTTNYDGFSHDPNKRTNIPNALFFAQEHSEMVTTKEATENSTEETQVISVMGLIELFKQYNFTVEENTTSDKEVSLDPELLGRVFENLLAAYNPETQESARKSTGSFYTPREIVEYMVEESLIAYLSGECSNEESAMRQLVKDDNVPQIDNPEKIIADLKKIKILDPACGSGAFPMGILLKITDIIEKLTPKEQFNRYETKLEIIKNCIYGIDIQAIAMLICKLRFFISLICDCEKDASKPNFGIIPLPNLETKFVAANSLLPAEVKQYDEDWTQDEHLKQLQKELLDLRVGIFNKRTHKAKLNNKIADRKICEEIVDYIKQNATQADEQKIAKLQAQIAQYEAELPKYAEDYWVDDTAVQQTLFGEKTLFRRNPNKEKREKLNALIKNCKDEIRKEQNKSVMPGFEKAVEDVTQWDPYNQNFVSPFFDAEWMFGVADGFDIVIGNPPYIQLQNNGGELAKMYDKCGFKTYARTGDIYCLFYERGYQLLKPNGHLCYITSNKWMRAGYGEKTREFLANNTHPQLLIDFAGVKIFESATVDTNILLFEKDAGHTQAVRADLVSVPNGNTERTQGAPLPCITDGQTLCCTMSHATKNNVQHLAQYVAKNAAPCTFSGSESWVILSPLEQSIKQKIEAVGTPLKDWDINIYRGVLTGYNDAFIITTDRRNEILANCQTDDERTRTAELIRPILRGRDIKRYGYDWAGLWLINTHNGVKGKYPPIDINDYPSIKQHLDLYWDKIKKRDDKGVTPYNLRNCAYMDDFFKPKIVYSETNDAFETKVCLDKERHLTDKTCFILVSPSQQILEHVYKIMSSKVFTWYMRAKSPLLGTRGISLTKETVETFPLCPISSTYNLSQEETSLIESV